MSAPVRVPLACVRMRGRVCEFVACVSVCVACVFRFRGLLASATNKSSLHAPFLFPSLSTLGCAVGPKHGLRVLGSLSRLPPLPAGSGFSPPYGGDLVKPGPAVQKGLGGAGRALGALLRAPRWTSIPPS